MSNNKLKSNKMKITVITLTVIAVLLVTAVSFAVLMPFIKYIETPENFRLWVNDNGFYSIIIYVLTVILQIVAAVIPGEPFEIAAGYAFGSLNGTLLCLLAESIGSIIVLLLVRKFGLRLVKSIFSEEKINSVKFIKNKQSQMILFALIFILPGTPKDLLCYLGGLTDINMTALILICTLGRFPSIITSVLAGNMAGTQRYLAAIIVFAVTAIISVAGIIIYGKLNKNK